MAPFPTCVGMNRGGKKESRELWAVPYMRGDEPPTAFFPHHEFHRSLHAWG